MPRLEKNKFGAGAGWTAPDVKPRRRWFTEDKISPVRCTVCLGRLVIALANAGERTHPACDGWPDIPAATPARKQDRKPAAPRPDSTRKAFR